MARHLTFDWGSGVVSILSPVWLPSLRCFMNVSRFTSSTCVKLHGAALLFSLWCVVDARFCGSSPFVLLLNGCSGSASRDNESSLLRRLIAGAACGFFDGRFDLLFSRCFSTALCFSLAFACSSIFDAGVLGERGEGFCSVKLLSASGLLFSFWCRVFWFFYRCLVSLDSGGGLGDGCAGSGCGGGLGGGGFP